MPQTGIEELTEKVTDYREQGEQLALGALSPAVAEKQGKFIVSLVYELGVRAVEFAITAASWIAIKFATVIMRAEDRSAPAFRDLTRTALKDLTGADIGAGHAAIGRTILESLAGGAGAAAGGTLGPSTAGAEKYMEIVMQLALEGYVEGGITSALSLGYLDKFTELDDILAQVLGLGRMSRRVMQPLMQARVITPFQWHVNKTYRPELLSPSDAVRQFLRGRWSDAQMREELARQGWTDERIDALANAQRKFHSAADVRRFVVRQHWTREQGLQHLRDQGYDEQAAIDALRVEGLRRIEQNDDAIAGALITAYANRNITKADFTATLATFIQSAEERALVEELAELRRALNVRQLSAADMRRLAQKRILSVVDFRRALEREGFDEFAVTALELELRFELDEQKRIEEHRRELEAERAAERQARDEERAARKREIEAERALRRRGPLADLERAAVRGLIPFSRVADVLEPQYDPDTVEILVALLEKDRQAYLAQQDAAALARKRAALRDVGIGDLEQAVLANQLTIEDFRRRLEFVGMAPADVDLLAGVLAARKRDVDEARAKRAAADEAAKRRQIDLGRFESLVRKGVRSLEAYDALLRDLNFDEASRAAMRELLDLIIAEDRQAAAERAAAEARLRNKGLSFEQFRRAVILGHKTLTQFDGFLRGHGFTADAIATLVAEASVAVDEAEAARQRRAAAEARSGARALPLSTIARAARLGVVSPTVYQARLAAEGYSGDDVAIEMELLLLEIADVQAARAKRDAVERDAQARNLSLAQVERAVKAGVLTLADYQVQAIALGYGADDVETVVSVLAQELATTADAERRRTTIEDELATRQLSLAQLEEAVTKGVKSIDTFGADVAALGYGSDDAALLTALLVVDLETAAAKQAGG